ncbi:uncharacterized protein F4812DRAFT_440243 [Daldinia caldariorum]|uniref:uncharacterized protein n=1 Tax=Daldinia caldariorum TaxID=326644 RepID=UPI0020083344|nr:uncharacterized protein F4812DRAFT_440243 [Daldinia caldariorum]KAI1465257.1 hypothetical protein F4812DRAFT_440243 [Daldinia caldariorum]
MRRVRYMKIIKKTAVPIILVTYSSNSFKLNLSLYWVPRYYVLYLYLLLTCSSYLPGLGIYFNDNSNCSPGYDAGSYAAATVDCTRLGNWSGRYYHNPWMLQDYDRSTLRHSNYL